MKGKEGGTRNRGRRNATKGIDTETTHTNKLQVHPFPISTNISIFYQNMSTSFYSCTRVRAFCVLKHLYFLMFFFKTFFSFLPKLLFGVFQSITFQLYFFAFFSARVTFCLFIFAIAFSV